MFHKCFTHQKAPTLNPSQIAAFLNQTDSYFTQLRGGSTKQTNQFEEERTGEKSTKKWYYPSEEIERYWGEEFEKMMKGVGVGYEFVSNYARGVLDQGTKFLGQLGADEEAYPSQRSSILKLISSFFAISLSNSKLSGQIHSTHTANQQQTLLPQSFQKVHILSTLLQVFSKHINSTMWAQTFINVEKDTPSHYLLGGMISKMHIINKQCNFKHQNLLDLGISETQSTHPLGRYMKCVLKLSITKMVNMIERLVIQRERLRELLSLVLVKFYLLINLEFLLWTFDCFDQRVEQIQDPAMKQVMGDLCLLYGMNGFISNSEVGAYLVTSGIQPHDLMNFIHEKELLEKSLVDKIPCLLQALSLFHQGRSLAIDSPQDTFKKIAPSILPKL